MFTGQNYMQYQIKQIMSHINWYKIFFMELKFNTSKTICTLIALFFSMFLVACGTCKKETAALTLAQQQVDPFKISKHFYDAVKEGQNAEKYAKQLAELSPEILKKTCKPIRKKKPFGLMCTTPMCSIS